MASHRGRKRNDNLPPNRARDVQRAFRARRAAHLSDLEQRIIELENENAKLRMELNLPPSNRQSLGRGPTGIMKPELTALDTEASTEASSAAPPSSMPTHDMHKPVTNFDSPSYETSTAHQFGGCWLPSAPGSHLEYPLHPYMFIGIGNTGLTTISAPRYPSSSGLGGLQSTGHHQSQSLTHAGAMQRQSYVRADQADPF
ncbi:hypothetical protein HGRIS_001312 [Hohenbuehelia grisea]|uniref:BZIP domain-containing protein n=1 Tax=Hohenbuehelia grisea TaxID=104357 RepID=A0ABR3JPJ0_9AGAR